MGKLELIALVWVTKNVPATPKTVPCGPSGHYGTLARPLVAVDENQEIENVVDEVKNILRQVSFLMVQNWPQRDRKIGMNSFDL